MIVVNPKVSAAITIDEAIDDGSKVLVDLFVGLPPMIQARLVPIASRLARRGRAGASSGANSTAGTQIQQVDVVERWP